MELWILDFVMVLIGRCCKYIIDCILFVNLDLSMMWEQEMERKTE